MKMRGPLALRSPDTGCGYARLFAALFYRDTAAPRSPTWLLEVENGSAAAKADLVERGFVDGAAAHRRLQRLVAMGVLLSGGRAPL